MRDEAIEVVRRLQAAGYEAYLVGGCVRDQLLGLEPEDYDVATAATPEQVAPLFAETREVGRAFGVLHARQGDSWIEVATFRSDGPYTDARHPDQVTFADVHTDARRRDFTVNALYLDPVTQAVHDFVGGRADLEAGCLRAVGDPDSRFAEDPLRLLRAVRFACRYGFEIETRTWEAMRRAAPGIASVSGERVRDEMLAVLTGPDRRRGLELLYDSGLLAEVAPEVVALRGVEQSPRHHPEGDVWEHTLRMLEQLRGADPVLALGALLHDIGKPATRSEGKGEIHFYGHEKVGQEIAARLLERWRVPGRTQEVVLAMIGQHMRFRDTPGMKRSTLHRFLLQPHFDSILELHRLDALGARGDLTTYDLCRREREAMAASPPPVRPLLSGDELLALGYAPGPRLGAMIRALVDAQLEGEVVDRDAARAWVRARYASEAGA